MNLRSKALEGLLAISNRFGGPIVWDALRGHRTKILMYHGITTKAEFEGVANYYGYNIPCAEFEQQIQYLRSHCNVLSLKNFLEGERGSRTQMNVVLTFDDGYENNFYNAFKVLQKYGMPAVYSLPTDFVINGQPLWNDVVEYAVNHSTKTNVSFQLNGKVDKFELEHFQGRLSLYNWLMRRCVEIDQQQRDPLLTMAMDELGIPVAEEVLEIEDYRPLRIEQILEMTKSGLAEFASHSVHHYLLSKLCSDSKRKELAHSKGQIESLIDAECSSLCLPGGSYDAETLEVAFDAGYCCVLTSDPGEVTQGEKVLNRNGVFREKNIQWFADRTHGPVLQGLQALRKVKEGLSR